MASPAITIEFLFQQYKDSIQRLAFKDDDFYKPYLTKDEEKLRLEFELKLHFEGFEYVGGGVSRKVFVHKRSRRCFKINFNGLPENEKEMQTFLSIDKHNRKHFAAAYGFINGETDLLEVEYCDWPLAKNVQFGPAKVKAYKTMRNLRNKYGFSDMHEGNYAINPETGDIKILDYAR